MFFKRFYQICITLLILSMGLATLVPLFTAPGRESTALLWECLTPSRFFNSTLFGLLWVLVIIALVGVTVFSRHATNGVRLLHLVLALTFSLIGYDKLTDRRFFLVLKENQAVTLTFNQQNPAATIKLQLLQFSAVHYPGNTAIANYQSKILFNNRDTLLLAINHPIKIGPYRLFLHSYQEQPYFQIIAKQDTIYGTLGDSTLWQNAYLTIMPPDTGASLPSLSYRGKTYRPLPNGRVTIEDQPLVIQPVGRRFINIIEVVHATKPKIILIFGLLYLGCLIYVFWWKSRP